MITFRHFYTESIALHLKVTKRDVKFSSVRLIKNLQRKYQYFFSSALRMPVHEIQRMRIDRRFARPLTPLQFSLPSSVHFLQSPTELHLLRDTLSFPPRRQPLGSSNFSRFLLILTFSSFFI